MSETCRFSVVAPSPLVASFDECLSTPNRSAALRVGMQLIIWLQTEAHPALAAMINAAAVDPNGSPETFRDMWVQCGAPLTDKKGPTRGQQLALPLGEEA